MKNSSNKYFKWHQTRAGLFIFGIVELGLAYVLASRAIDTGSWWEYLLTIILLVGSTQNIVRLLGSFWHGTNKSTKA